MNAIGYIDIATSILSIATNGCESLKALFIVAFLTGRNEVGKRMRSINEICPSIVGQLVDVLERTLNGRSGDDYPLGTFCLKLTINACQVLSVSDSNKGLLVTTPLLQLLVRALQMFQNNEMAIWGCGGGGKDVESVELAVETLANLSFFYDNDDQLRTKYMTVETGVLELMLQLSQNSKLVGRVQDNIQVLIRRLTPTTVATTSDSNSSAVECSADLNTLKRSHIMLSYCWSAEAKPEIVRKLYEELVAAGCDVWLDTVSIPFFFSIFYFYFYFHFSELIFIL